MLRTKIIASSIANLSDARYFAAWNVDAIGFDLNAHSPHFASPNLVNALREWISGPFIIGEFDGIQGKEKIDSMISLLELDAIQLGPFCPNDWKFSVPVYREILLDSVHDFPPANAYIIKSENPTFHWKSEIDPLQKIIKLKPCFIDFPLNPIDYNKIIHTLNPEGFVLRGGEEEKVGFKSFDEVDEIMEVLNED